MRQILSIGIVVLLAGAAGASAGPAVSPDAPVILEPGFQTSQLERCGYRENYHGPSSTWPARGSIIDIECSPSKDWGKYVYLAVNQLYLGDPVGFVERVSPNDKTEVFTSTAFGAALNDISFTPPGWRGGSLLLLSERSASAPSSFGYLVGTDPTHARLQFAFRLEGGIYFSAADPSGAFDSDLFYYAAN